MLLTRRRAGTVIAVVAPWHVQNSAVGMASGALAYAVNAHTGAVRPLDAGVSLAYFNPGCGAGSKVALTRFGGQADQTTQVLGSPMAVGTGRITSDATGAAGRSRRRCRSAPAWSARSAAS